MQKQPTSLKDRLVSFVKSIQEKAQRLPAGPEKDSLLKKAQQADTAIHVDEWVKSSGLKPPE